MGLLVPRQSLRWSGPRREIAMATLTVTTTTDYQGGATETNIDEIAFTANATAIFASSQFGAGLISNSVQITGNNNQGTVGVILSAPATFSAAGWTFASWPAGARSNLHGTSGADTITGSAREDTISGDAGADILDGGASNDIFQYTAPSHVVAGEQIFGGGGVLDTIEVLLGSADYSFEGVTISGVERLQVQSAGTIAFRDNFAFTSVIGSDLANLVVGISAGNLDLSGVAFTVWTPGMNTIVLNGSFGDNELTGSDKDDTIHGAGGLDEMLGGDGDDVFVYAASSELVFDGFSGETISGQAGTDTLQVAGTGYNFSLHSLSELEALRFSAAGSARFHTSQLGGAGCIVAVTGSSGTDAIAVFGGDADLSALTFAPGSWTAGADTITIDGSLVADIIFGSSQNDIIIGLDGADTLNGGDGDDTFLYTAPGQNPVGEVLNGGNGIDRLVLSNISGIGLTGVTLSSIETLVMSGGLVGLLGTQLGSSAITRVVGAAGADTLAISGSQTVNLADIIFESWDAADAVTIFGTSGNDSLIGSSQSDVIRGENGDDTLAGGPGADTARYSFTLSNFTVQEAGGRIFVSGINGNDTLTGFEHLEFNDRTLDVPADDGSVLFDSLFYLSQNLDVLQAGVDPLLHYTAIGRHEGRDPNAFFDTSGYLAANPDVAASGANPLEHYLQTGWLQGRDPSADFDTTLYLLHNPDVAAAGINPLVHFLVSGRFEGRSPFPAIGQTIAGGFDAEFYLFHNPDVAAAGIDPLTHFNISGRHEGRDPNAWFDTSGYLSHYADVAAAGIDPLLHYMSVGWIEGRDPSAGFDTLGYLAANPDVAAAGINPLDHFLRFGIYEGRAAINDGVFA
jgi:Ca2+-binding RTX toxin-like protein